MILRLTSLACCLCLSAHVWAAAPEESPVEAAYNQANKQWMIELTHHLAGVENPLTNVLGSFYLDVMSKTYPALEGQGQQIRASALEKGWSNPAVVLKVFETDCVLGKTPDSCDYAAFQSQLRKLDPTNAAMVLLPWHFYDDVSQPHKSSLTVENEVILLKAAQMDSFNLYMTSGIYDAYLAIKLYEQQHFQPEIPQELLIKLEESDFGLPLDPLWGPTTSIALSAFTFNRTTMFTTLVNLCALAKSEGRSRLIQACLDIANLLQSNPRSYIEETMGHAVRKRIERPGYIGAKKENNDPERWRDLVRHLEYKCAQPRILHSGQWSRITAEHWSRYIQELQENGEVVANNRAAMREYVMYPEMYEMNPSECSRIHTLDEETQQWLAREQEIELLDSVLQRLDIE